MAEPTIQEEVRNRITVILKKEARGLGLPSPIEDELCEFLDGLAPEPEGVGAGEPEDGWVEVVELAAGEMMRKASGHLAAAEASKALDRLRRLRLTLKRDLELQPLVRRAQEDPQGFDELWRKCEPWLKPVAGKVLWHCPGWSEEDVLQRASAQTWRSLEKYKQERGMFLSWAGRIVRRQHPRHRPKGEVELDGVAESNFAVEQQVETPSRTLPSPAIWELLNYVQQSEPHRALAFLLRDYAKVPSKKLAAECADWPLRKVYRRMTDAVEKFKLLATLSADRVFTQLRQKMEERGKDGKLVGDMAWREFAQEEMDSEIGKWAKAVWVMVARRVVQQGKDFLRRVAELKMSAHKKLAFLYGAVLRLPVSKMARECGGRSLRTLCVGFEVAAPPLAGLEPEQIKWAVAPLRKEIDQLDAKGEILLSAYFVGGAPEQLLQEWRRQVQVRAIREAAEVAVLGFSWICGCMEIGGTK